jgi:large subunit ribosomal protein L6
MKKELIKKIEIPEGIEVSINKDKVTVKNDGKKNEREFDLLSIKMEKKGNEIILEEKKASKKEKRRMNTIASHIKNMIKGVQEHFVYELKIAASHFPMTVKVEGNKALIKNFLGEKVDRICAIPKGAEVKVDGRAITVKSYSKEIAGQAAANFETATRITNRDRRTFQDGIFMINKAGKEI